jgi:hypothetical protein
MLGVIFDTGAIHGCPYTSRDVRIMRKIYGECEACIKGKSVKPSTKMVKNRFLPFASGKQLCIDIFCITFRTRGGKIIYILPVFTSRVCDIAPMCQVCGSSRKRPMLSRTPSSKSSSSTTCMIGSSSRYPVAVSQFSPHCNQCSSIPIHASASTREGPTINNLKQSAPFVLRKTPCV